MRGLDDYIMGVNIHSEEMFLHQCPKCKTKRQIPMFYELGGWFYPNEDDDPYCLNCKMDMDIVEED